jgi:hypothetical protein
MKDLNLGELQRFLRVYLGHISHVVLSISINSPCTAYVNGQRQGRIMERPFSIGDNIAREIFEFSSSKPLPTLDIEGEMKLASDFTEASEVKSVAQKMKELGLER